MGRKTTYTQEIADEICERLSKGEPLEWICKDAHMPESRTVHRWTAQDSTKPVDVPSSFASDFARARVFGYDCIAADALRIADTPITGVETVTKPDGSQEIKEGDMLGHRKLQIETRLKLLAKWDPKRYGDKLALGGADDMGPIKTESVIVEFIKPKNE